MTPQPQTAPSDPERWKKLESLFDRASELDPREREQFIAEACGDDTEMRRELESLLASADQTLRVLRNPIVQAAQQIAARTAPEDRIGPYRLLRLIGSGGMGDVYLALRADEHYEHRVAIKLMQTGAAQSDALLDRFRAERQILANLDHPNIARLLDGGATERLTPYLVMEYVEGVPIDDYCRAHELSTIGRLELFEKVCAAVDYAHRSLIVHRDIKPGNILVTGEGAPKLLDFGIAKLLDPERSLSEATRATERLMTPEYASPEQVRGQPVTTSTDVYGLGVLLYELLTGRRPLHLPTGPPMAVVRAICEQQPEPPSAKLAAATGRKPVRARRIGPELDAIVLKAMSKSPADRYESVAKFAADLAAYRAHRPVAAVRAGWRYPAWKFLQRNTLATALATAAVVALAGLSAGFAIMARQADQERRIADRQARFLVNMFRAATPEGAHGKIITARDLLDQGAGRVDRDFSTEPAVRGSLLHNLAEAYQSLGLYPEAKDLVRRAYDLKVRALGPSEPSTGDSLFLLANLTREEGEYAKAEPLFRDLTEIRRRSEGSRSAAYAQSLAALGECLYLEGDDSQAEPVLRRGLDIYRRAGPSFGSEVRIYLALLLERKGQYPEAAGLLREAVEIDRKAEGADGPNYANSLHNLASALIDVGDLAGAEARLRETLKIRRKVLGKLHPDLSYTLNNLGYVLLEEGKWAAAEPFLKEAMELNLVTLGEQHPRTAASIANWGRLLQAKGDYPGAEREFDRALGIMRSGRGFTGWQTAQILENLGLLEFDQRHFPQAETWARQALEMKRKLGGEDTPGLAVSLINLGEDEVFQGEFAAAEPLLRQGLEIRQRKYPSTQPLVITAEVRLAEDLLAEGDAARAEAVLRTAMKAIQAAPFPSLSWQRAEAESALAACLEAQHRSAEADALASRSQANLGSHPRPPLRQPAVARIAELVRQAHRSP